jgi:glutamate dehydrogenase/leucine dehydrogenase
VPAALENQIHKGNAAKIKAKMIIEMANGPTASEADPILHKKGIWVIPDVLANSGGVATSYLEWKQNLSHEHWSKEKVLKQLIVFMTKAWKDVLKMKREYKSDFRTASFILAINRIVLATKK